MTTCCVKLSLLELSTSSSIDLFRSAIGMILSRDFSDSIKLVKTASRSFEILNYSKSKNISKFLPRPYFDSKQKV